MDPLCLYRTLKEISCGKRVRLEDSNVYVGLLSKMTILNPLHLSAATPIPLKALVEKEESS